MAKKLSKVCRPLFQLCRTLSQYSHNILVSDCQWSKSKQCLHRGCRQCTVGKRKPGGHYGFSHLKHLWSVFMKNVNFPPHILKQRECVQLFVWCSVRPCLHLKDSQCKTHGGRSASAGATEGAVLLLLLFLLLLLLLLLLLCTFSPAGYTYHALCQHATICPDHSHHPYPNPNHDIAHE